LDEGFFEAVVVKASDIAKRLAPFEGGDAIMAKFGKIFEEEYTLAAHLYEKMVFPRYIPRKFAKKVAARLKEEGIYSTDLVAKAVRAYAALLSAGAVGEKPSTEFREYEDRVFIAAQPDLYSWSEGKYYEFKLYQLNDYARVQARIFAWVLEEPIVLIGLREVEGGYFSAHSEVVSPPKELDVRGMVDLKGIGTTTTFCAGCMRPETHCRCGYGRYNDGWDDEGEEGEEL